MSEFTKNVVFRSTVTGRIYFAPKVRHLKSGASVVSGKKFDITSQLRDYLQPEFRLPEHFVCDDCGEHVKADEDGCCVHCGADCLIEECHCNGSGKAPGEET